ncbi:Protein of unknown function [Bacillus cereus]|uniref:Uncharacterized protein n=1 Tax=Bacillus wiedmannii TaxID=1890302 RepID=A0AB37YXY6_9BACI|nr:Protein of unknown function [Bacillus wiedmannii]SCC63729.1 Protein of unknown function [Bacillus cereus]SCN08894.1 Protein of unknown function [Bacillus wiedmannii]SCN39356.1 Protein of unknown function [Bacillus wiedmannii]
MTGLVIGWTV